MTIDLNDPEVKEAVQALIDEETRGLKAKRDELLGTVAEMKKRYDGIDPDKVRELLEREQSRQQEEDERNKKAVEEKKDFEGLKRQYEQAMAAKEKAIQQLQDQLDQRTKALHRQIAEQRLHAEIERAGGIAEVLKPHLLPRVNVIENDHGDYEVQVMNGSGPMLDKNGNPASISDLIAEFRSRESFAPIFRSDVKPGSGSTSATSRMIADDGDNPWSKDKENISMQRYLEKHQPERAELLKRQAGAS